MPARASFAVNDRETSPVAHTFLPRGRDSEGVWEFYEAGSTAIGENQFTIQIRESGANYKVRIKLELPIVVTQTINGVSQPVVDRTSFVDSVFTMSKRSSVQERKNLVGLHYNALAAANTVFNDVLTKFEDIY
jgi:hypothetical protein